MSDDDPSRRAEINAFAAMATGGFDFSSSTDSNNGTFDSTALSKAPNADSHNGGGSIKKSNDIDPSRQHMHQAVKGDDEFFEEGNPEDKNQKKGGDDAFLKSFAEAGQRVENSGTFSRLTPAVGSCKGRSSISNRNQNLEAAALALADPSDQSVGGGANGSENTFQHTSSDDPSFPFKKSSNDNVLQFPCGAVMSNLNTNNPGVDFECKNTPDVSPQAHGGKIPQNKTPMHVQKVRVNRPFFFGSALPTRVVKEVRGIIDAAFEEQRREYEEMKKEQHDLSKVEKYNPSIGQLSPEIRNLVSAIQCYGSDISSLRLGGEGHMIDHLSVFCPKWSEDCQKHSTTNTTGCFSDSDKDSNEKQNHLPNNAKLDPFRGNKSGYDSMGKEINIEDTNTKKTSAESTGCFPSETHHEEEYREQEANGNGQAFRPSDTGISERDMFSTFARHGSDCSNFSFDKGDDGVDSAVHSNTTQTFDSQNDKANEIFFNPESKMIRSSGVLSKSSDGINSCHTSNDGDDSKNGQILSEQALFTQWVRAGDSPANANSSNSGTMNITKASNGNNKSFFKSASGGIVSDDSDDDYLVVSEMKKKVGVNEHLNAALVSLEEDHSPIEVGATDATVEEVGELTQVPLSQDGGRALSNQELMDGHAPFFGVDDPPLPSESDLGNHETREEQQRSKEQRRIQAFIEKLCPQNIFGPLACPNPALSPDDNHSWNSMSTPLQSNTNTPSTINDADVPLSATSPMSRSASSDDLVSMHSASGTARRMSSIASHSKVYDLRTRYGWWNNSDDEDADDSEPVYNRNLSRNPGDILEESKDEVESKELPIQLPPVEHASNTCLIQTRLKPSPDTLHKQNRPLSELHPATSLVQALPFLSDRPPSHRYLQVDTQAVAFPALGGEVEPLFCTVAIYHVETIAHSLGDRGMAPIPDLQRCGKITETLNFDVVNDVLVEKRCFSSLSPYALNTNNESPQLTRCGVFPLPSNLSLHNLYAIITVSKVISEGSDFEPYLRAKSKGKEENIDTEILRAKAEKASINHGKFIMPFAFGVAPLLQVFGADLPHVPSSRAVQIPLFRFFAGNGERQIIDHIMVMLYPRADHRASGIGGPAPVTNGGTAMLVMRNFGYLGLHEVVNSKSSLARDRLVDFTGEMQLRRQGNKDNNIELLSTTRASNDSTNIVTPAWQSHYIAEPTTNGGRSDDLFHSSNYAQELAPVPLLTAPLGRPGGTLLSVPKSRIRGHSSGEDIEPYFHTNFCNELLCHPRILHNCQKGNIAIKIEMREIEFNSEHGVFLAHSPSFGPAIHNFRRGPFLVQEAYTSCSARCADPNFLDEFKLKLPLVLGGKNEARSMHLFFTVYRLSFSSRKKWSLRLLGRKRSSRKGDEIAGDIVGESNIVSGKDCQLIQLGCGFLPLEKKESLLNNGNHEVKISYASRYPLPDFCEKQKIDAETLIVSDFSSGKGDSGGGDDSITDDCESQSSDRYVLDTASATSISDRDTVISENMEDNKTKQKKRLSGMLLKVRISVHSSIHSQNATLNEFLSQEPDVSIPLKGGGNEIQSFLSLGRDEIARHFSRSSLIVPSENIQYETKKLLISTVDLAKSEMCSVSDISLHLLRVCKLLWKITVVGTGNHDLEWANPSAALPLRVNAFATLLQILGSSTMFLSKRGVTQLDGKSKWNFVSLSRVMGLLFDEREMFGVNYDEKFSNNFLSALSESKEERKATNPRQRKNRRHVRSNFEFVHNGDIGTSSGSDDLNAIISENNSSVSKIPNRPKQKSDSPFLTNAPEFDVFTLPDTPNIKQGKPSPLSTLQDRETLNDKQSESQKMDTVGDFMSALKAGSREKEFDDDVYEGKYSGNVVAASWIKAFGGSSGGSNRRWMTAPAPGLSTIQENPEDCDRKQGPLDSIGSEIHLSKEKKANGTSKRSVKQFRVPKLANAPSSEIKSSLDIFDNDSKGPFPPTIDSDQLIDLAKGVTLLSIDSPPDEKNDPRERKEKRGQTLPTTDADMLEAGSSFLDAIEKSLGLGASFSSNYPQEEEGRVYGRHHKKTISHSSIDWSIPNDDLSNLLAGTANDETNNIQVEPIAKFDESMGTLSQEIQLSLKLPSYSDRLSALGDSNEKNGRWFPYTYEVIIMQWAAILIEQQKSTIDPGKDVGKTHQVIEDNNAISDAASRTSGSIIACAPILFEVIKQSLGGRVTSLIKCVTRKSYIDAPPLVTLDEVMMANLEQLIAMLTDACLDSRNFDSWETRQGCVDVNDSIVCFLRDMFSFLDPSCVYRLTMIYWSRLVARDGRQWQDRDSSIGLRCSWEITKLQMNAISAFVRFPDFIKVNSPQMNSWTNWQNLSPTSTVNFFDNILSRYEQFGLPSILSDSTNQERIELPRMRPHWLAEIVIDICFSGIEHAEQNIQQRSAALLFELFWSQGQISLREGFSPIVGAMYATFIEKVLSRTSYLSTCFTPKSQVRRNVILCVIFVLQNTPSGLLRALWRKLFMQSSGKGSLEKYGGITSSVSSESLLEEFNGIESMETDENHRPNIYDMFSLLNVCLTTVEYEGNDENAEVDGVESDGPLRFWHKEFLMTRERDTTDSVRRRRLLPIVATTPETKENSGENAYTTSASRKWLAHDGSIVLIRTAQQIVRELRFVLEPVEGSQSLFNPARRKAKIDKSHLCRSSLTSRNCNSRSTVNCLKFSYLDTIVFVRGATSVYLNSLVLRESDIALVKTLNASVEIIKIFGIKIFNEAVGETLQHWLRMITFHCGSRRAEVRVPASDFAELLLRSTWDCFGSFFRIRIPLLAVQTEVMERIVATATARYYRDKRKSGPGGIELFSNSSAEASLTPLWRTTDRLHHQSASQNVAFRSSLVRLAEKLKKLHKAYIAAHALSYQNRSQSQDFMNSDADRDLELNSESETLRRANRISVIRVVNASAGYSKQFLGLSSLTSSMPTLAHHEALEDAFLDAADVFSPTELPDHRVAWLRKLAQFHATRSKNAEEATCHYMIYYTLNRSSRMSRSLWSSTPFLPWIDNLSDGIEGPASDPDGNSICDLPELDYGRQSDKTNSFRRIFYRNENSVRLNAGELETGTTKAAFYGVSLTSEYLATTPWITIREMEALSLEEVSAAGELFFKSGVIASSRYMWSLAAQYYAEKFMYGKLIHVYERLARTVVSQVPNIDNTLEQAVNVGIPLGKFYRVWFHGGAPDELIGAEFVYRTPTNMTLTRFGKDLRDVLRCIIPAKTPIHLVLDGRPEESVQPNLTGFIRMGGAPLEPVKVKVTPLRPVVRNASMIRGLPEWFEVYIDNIFCGQTNSRRSLNDIKRLRANDTDAYRGNGGYHHSRSYSSSIHSSGNLAQAGKNMGYSGNNQSHYQLESPMEGELVGAEKFWFIQSMNKDRSRGTRDWLKGSSGDFSEKTLRVTQLQVRQAFPACISRQTVVHRVVYTQSPLEAAVDNMCLWCAVLFRTSISSNGSVVLGLTNDPGIGIEAAKVVSECIHSSRVKEMGISLLKKNGNFEVEDDDILQSYDRLDQDEVQEFQLKLARSFVVFMELLHLLISRNRDLLLDVIQTRKKNEIGSILPVSKHGRDASLGSYQTINKTNNREVSSPAANVVPAGRSRHGVEQQRRTPSIPGTTTTPSTDRSRHGSEQQRYSNVSAEIAPSSVDGRLREKDPSSKSKNVSDDYSANTITSLKEYGNERTRTDSAIGVQRELQQAFINIAKELYPMIHGIMGSDTPRWLKQCCQDNYFSAYTYRQAKIPISEELTFEDVNTSSFGLKGPGGPNHEQRHPTMEKLGLIPNYRSDRSYHSQSQGPPGSPGGSIGSNSAVSRGSETGRSVKSARSLRGV